MLYCEYNDLFNYLWIDTDIFIDRAHQVPLRFDENGILRQKGVRLTRPPAASSHLPLRSPLWASGFSFSRAADTLLRVRYDPLLPSLFFGEESSMAARYDI